MTAFMSISPQTTYTRVYPHSPVCTGNLPTMQVYVLAYMCTCVQRAQPLSHSTHCCLSKKPSCAPQRQGNWVESMSLSHHLMALPAPLLALLTPYPFPRAHTQLTSPLSYPLQPFLRLPLGTAPGTHMCKVEAPSARPIRGETSELRDIKLVVRAIYSCWGARACLEGLGQRVGLQYYRMSPCCLL